MAHNKKRTQLINEVHDCLAKQLPQDEFRLLKLFSEQFFTLLSYDDLRQYTIMDLAGMLQSYWHFFKTRQKHESKVRVFNPTYEQDGWQSPHTIIEIAQDDMPFLVDSARMEINRHKLAVHLIIHAGGMCSKRDANNNVTEILPWGSHQQDVDREAPIHIEIDKRTDPQVLQQLENDLTRVLKDVQVAVDDWQAMCVQVQDSIASLTANSPSISTSELDEINDFLQWLEYDNFTFLGCRDYDLVGEGEQQALQMRPETGLGVLRATESSLKFRNFSDMTPEALNLMLSPQALIIAKTNTQSTVHRPVYTDYIGVKRFDDDGKLIGERRFIGLFTSSAYNSAPQNIPFLRLKIARILEESGMLKKSHSRKALLNILETYPRNDLFQGNIEELKETALGIFSLQERNRVRLFLRKDVYGRYISCMVYMPKHQFTDELRQVLQEILEWNFSGKTAEYYTHFTDSVLARIHFMIRIDPDNTVEYSTENIEKQLIDAVHSWKDNLKSLLLDYYGEEYGLQLFARYKNAFPAGYREHNSANVGVSDLKHIEQITYSTKNILNLYREANAEAKSFNFKIYQLGKTAPLSDVMPILENMGMKVVGEHPYEITRPNGQAVFINDFQMQFHSDIPVNLNNIKEKYQTTFAKVWAGTLENDRFNNLIILSQLDWQQVNLIRGLAKYLRQTGVPYSQSYIENTFNHYPKIARMLIEFFNLRFALEENIDKAALLTNLEAKLESSFDEVNSLDEDKILRIYFNLIKAILRTNYFQEENGKPKNYLSIKFAPKEISILPKPLPEYEIFVYSSRFEGVHLRCGKVARGGLRWSDRREDFRTEVLGLMKAQQVKNSVIVPTGAKGGFFVKSLDKVSTRDEQLREGIACYKNFIRGLLDITDNIVDGVIVKPKKVVCHDGDDPYLVVAADKGTATFSDIANDISAEYKFWLQDAFASGGRTGYDHKKMAITAKGAWVSVKRHFKNFGIDTQSTDFTVAGIGDMSGDVFGNGMLLSKHIRLVAAFDHRHIFIDPNPDAAISYAERARLFELPRSSWQDYNPSLISKGGGVFSRQEKSIKLSKECREVLGIEKSHIVPNDLISAILRMQVDLLWNGGIGTYVKASKEQHADVGDRATDAVRVNANELQCKVVGEGGNLGFTQAGRVEYALNGGEIYTDFIDNSAGVDCSDKEVNIKILLNSLMTSGKLSYGQRNRMLRDMTDEVNHLVLTDNEKQTLAIELAKAQAHKQVDLYGRFSNLLEEKKIIDRDLEALPSIDTLMQRKSSGKGLTTPEISVLISYSKLFLQSHLLDSTVPEDPWLAKYLYTAFSTTYYQTL